MNIIGNGYKERNTDFPNIFKIPFFNFLKNYANFIKLGS